MSEEGFGRQLIKALARSSPAFSAPVDRPLESRLQQLVVALARSGPAFRPRQNPDAVRVVPAQAAPARAEDGLTPNPRTTVRHDLSGSGEELRRVAGSPQPLPDLLETRVDDSDRERAAHRLQKALSEGRITVSELEERLVVVYAARYEVDLLPPLADLPPEGPPVAMTPAGPPLVLKAGMSAIKRTGAWRVPARIRVLSGMGSVLLDFCDADNPHPVVEVELELGAGSAKLLLPDDATANVDDLVSGMGSVRSAVPSTPQPGHPHFVVHGRAAMGSVRVRRRFRLRKYFV